MVVVHAALQRASLHTETGFGGAVALELVYPHEFMYAPAAGQLVDAYASPGLIVKVVPKLLNLRGGPRLSHLLKLGDGSRGRRPSRLEGRGTLAGSPPLGGCQW